MNNTQSLTHEMMESNRIRKGCNKTIRKRVGSYIICSKDNLCCECETKLNELNNTK